MKKTYLNELVNNGLIDYESSKIDSRQYIYYPVVESPKNLPSVTFNNNHIDNISPLSNLNQFDNFSQLHVLIYKKIINNIYETWIFSEIIRLLRYRIDFTNIKGPLADYLNDNEEFQILNNNHCFYNGDNEEEKKIILSEDMKESNTQKGMENKSCCNKINNNTNIRRVTIRQFIKRYVEIPKNQFDIQWDSRFASFGKISPIVSNLRKFDVKDI
jgi:hypothetical protein